MMIKELVEMSHNLPQSLIVSPITIMSPVAIVSPIAIMSPIVTMSLIATMSPAVVIKLRDQLILQWTPSFESLHSHQ